MEEELFNWKGWDQDDAMSFCFYDIVLKQQIGVHPPGSKFSSACINYETGTLNLYKNDADTVPYTYTLRLVVV